MAFLVTGHQNVVLVFAFLSTSTMRRHSIAVFSVVVPFAFVLEAIGPFGNTKTTTFIIFPLAHIRLRHAGVQLLILLNRFGLMVIYRWIYFYLQSETLIGSFGHHGGPCGESGLGTHPGCSAPRGSNTCDAFSI